MDVEIKKVIQRIDSILPKEKANDAQPSSSSRQGSGQALQSQVSQLLGSHGHSTSDVFASCMESLLLPVYRELCQLLTGGADLEDCLLSIHHIKVVYSASELAWAICMQPTIEQCAGFRFPRNPLPTSMLLPKHSLQDLELAAGPLGDLLPLVHLLAQTVTHDLFAHMMLPRFFDRLLLVAFVCLRDDHEGSVWEGRDRVPGISAFAQDLLEQLTTRDAYKSLAVSKLRSFTSAPLWLRAQATATLQAILTSPAGVLAVLTGYLDDVLESPQLPLLQAQVAKMIAAVPKQAAADPSAYYSCIAPQVLDLLHKGAAGDQMLLGQAVAVALRMMTVQPQLTNRLLLDPLLGGLRDGSTEQGRECLHILQALMAQSPVIAEAVTKMVSSWQQEQEDEEDPWMKEVQQAIATALR